MKKVIDSFIVERFLSFDNCKSFNPINTTIEGENYYWNFIQ